MAWISASFLADAVLAETFSDALLAAGALSASIEDADAGTSREKPQFVEVLSDGHASANSAAAAWARSRVVALFAEKTPVERVMRAAAAALGLAAPPDFTLGRVEEENWVALTQAQFDPIRISGRLWIVPSWHAAPDPDAINLRLDPGMAFGTGSHPTTRLCLEWLERANPAGKSLLDYGCGSGILAIAAAKLGAVAVTGVDIDPQAVAAARANARKNGVDARFEVSTAMLEGEYDLVVANILANPLRALAPALCGHVRPGGSLALSGILEEQAAEIIDLYAPWLSLTVADTGEGWVSLTGVRPRP
jgi:ribosomal protein L11 methyltransferase